MRFDPWSLGKVPLEGIQQQLFSILEKSWTEDPMAGHSHEYRELDTTVRILACTASGSTTTLSHSSSNNIMEKGTLEMYLTFTLLVLCSRCHYLLD